VVEWLEVESRRRRRSKGVGRLLPGGLFAVSISAVISH
jgi:hypothetical protein